MVPIRRRAQAPGQIEGIEQGHRHIGDGLRARFGYFAGDVDLLGTESRNAHIHLRAFNKLSQPFGNIHTDFRYRFSHHGDLADIG